MRVQKIQHLATGGSGEVFLGVYETSAGLKRLCAIKQLKDRAESQEEINQFRNEAEICKYFAHQNVVQLYEYTLVESCPTMLIEYVMGQSLNWICGKIFGTGIMMAPSMVAWIASESAAALDYVHGLKHPLTGEPFRLVHRDVTPSNLLLSYNGDVKLADFGIYKSTTREQETKVGLVKGTISYVSPEQIRGETATPQSDLYSLGVVLWQLLAGRKLFHGESDMNKIMMRTAAGDIPRDVREVNSDAHPGLASMVARLLSSDPRSRYPNARSLRQHAEQILAADFARFTREKLGFFVESIDEEFCANIRKVATEAMQRDLSSPPHDSALNRRQDQTNESFSGSPSSPRHSAEGLSRSDELPFDEKPQEFSSLKKGRELELSRRDAIVGAKIASHMTGPKSNSQIVRPPLRYSTGTVRTPQAQGGAGLAVFTLVLVLICMGLYILWQKGLFA